MPVSIKSDQEIEQMRVAGRITALTLKELEKAIRPGITTYELDHIAEAFILSQGAKPNFKNYNGFPASVCISINDEVVHGIPTKKRVLKDGDIVSLDTGCVINGFHGDAARTYAVGNISDEARKLIEVTEQSFFEGMKYAKEGNHLYEISEAIQAYAELHGFSVVRDLTGHGIGRKLHEDPSIPNFKVSKQRGLRLQAGMTLAIEPMINAGDYEVEWLDDYWTVVTEDGSLSAHYENTVLITEEGCELLTLI